MADLNGKKKKYENLNIENAQTITSTQREKLLLKTAKYLPDNPADSGMRASAVKPKFYSFATDTEDSLYAYLNNAIIAFNNLLEVIKNKINVEFSSEAELFNSIIDEIERFKGDHTSHVETTKIVLEAIKKSVTDEVTSRSNADKGLLGKDTDKVYNTILGIGNLLKAEEEKRSSGDGKVLSDSNSYTDNKIKEALDQEALNRKTAIDNAIKTLINNSPTALDTLHELSKALGDDPNFATTITTLISDKHKASKEYADEGLKAKVDISQGSANGNKVMMTDSSGNITNVSTLPSSVLPSTGVSSDKAKALELKNGTLVPADDIATNEEVNKKINAITQEVSIEATCSHEISQTGCYDDTDTILEIKDQEAIIKKVEGRSDIQYVNMSSGVAEYVTMYIYSISNCHLKPNTTYTITTQGGYGNGWRLTVAKNSLDESIVLLNGYGGQYGEARTFTTPSDLSEATDWILALRGTFTSTDNKWVMLAESDVEIPYKPYDKNNINNYIKNTSISGIKSVGRNLFDLSKTTNGGFYFSSLTTLTVNSEYFYCNDLIPVSPNTIHYLSWNYTNDRQHFIIYCDSSGNMISNEIILSPKTFITPQNCMYIKFSGYLKNKSSIMLGFEALPYEPYQEETLNLSGNVNRKIGVVDMGTLTYDLSQSGLFRTGTISKLIKPSVGNNLGNILSSIYTTIDTKNIIGPNGTNPSPDMVMALNNSGTIYFNNLSYTDATSFKTAMNGVMLYYELATPTTEEYDSNNTILYGINDNCRDELILTNNNTLKVWKNGQIQQLLNGVDNIGAKMTIQYAMNLQAQVIQNSVRDTEQQNGILSLKNDLIAQKEEITLLLNEKDDKSLYNLGAYDSVVDNGDGTSTITRKTGYCVTNIDSWIKTSEGDYFILNRELIPNNSISFSNLYLKEEAQKKLIASVPMANWNERIPNTLTIALDIRYYTSNITDIPVISIQYKLATPYTEKVITKQPLLNLDSNGTQFLRDEWEKGLNICNPNDIILSNSNLRYENLKAGTYYIRLKSNSGYAFLYGAVNSPIRVNKNESVSFTILTDKAIELEPYDLDSNEFMISYGFSSAYQPYNANKHITNAQANLLLSEEEKSRNLFSSELEVGTILNGVDTDRDGSVRTVDYIKVSPNVTYTISNVNSPVVQFYNSNKVYLSNIYQDVKTFTTPSDCYFIKVTFSGTTNSKPMLSFEDLPYTPYYGEIVHQKELSDEFDKQINGGSDKFRDAVYLTFDGEAVTAEDIYVSSGGSTIANVLQSLQNQINELEKIAVQEGTRKVSGTTGNIKSEDGYYIYGGNFTINSGKIVGVKITGSMNVVSFSGTTINYTLKSIRENYNVSATITYYYVLGS